MQEMFYIPPPLERIPVKSIRTEMVKLSQWGLLGGVFKPKFDHLGSHSQIPLAAETV